MKIPLVSAACLLSAMSQAATPIDGLYASVFGGYAYVPNNVQKSQFGLRFTDVTYQSGFDAGGSIGYKNNPMRYEGEITYLNADVRHFNVNGIRLPNSNGYTNAILGMANVFYDFPNFMSCLQPFLGAGIGYAWVEAKLNSPNLPTPTRFSATNNVFAYQGMVGLTYNFAENYAINVGYRYIGTEKAHHLGKMVQAHLANVGVIYRFEGNRFK